MFVWIHHILMHLHQHNRFIKKTQPLRPQNVRFGFWSLVAAAAQSSVVCDSLKSTPIRRLSVQLYKQKLSIYLPETLVVSPSVFLNIMVSLQKYHKPCSRKKQAPGELDGLVRRGAESCAEGASFFWKSTSLINRAAPPWWLSLARICYRLCE